MRCQPIAVAIAMAVLAAPSFAAGSGEISASRNPISPGQSVTLKWYFSGTKIMVSGGRYGKGTDVTGKTTLTDTPRTTTRYVFEVTYLGKKAGSEQMTPMKARYSIEVQVVDSQAYGFTSYSAPQGWRVNYVKGW